MNRSAWFGVTCILLMGTQIETYGQTAFTYQGQLKNSGSPASGTYDLQFKLWNALTGGGQVGSTQCSDNVSVVNGLFTVTLDFGAQFNGSARWLEIGVRADSTAGNCGAGSYTTLSPRQALTAAPYASFSAAPWATSGSDISYTSGNVGIGNARLLGYNPGDSFSYDGKTMGHYTAGWFDDSWNGFGATAWLSGYGGVKLFSNGTPRMAIDQGGNVGIGTTNPVGPLSLGDYQGGTVGSAVAAFSKQLAVTGAYNTGTNTGNSVKLWIGDYDNDAGGNIYPIYCEDENNGVDFYIHNQGGSRTAYFGGNVGVGTTTPAGSLDVGGKVISSFGGGDGALDIVNSSGQEVAYMATGAGHAGLLGVTQPGTFTLHAGAYWDATTSKGVLFGEVKNFREPDPENPAQDIVYACVEGPEAAMYLRGTGSLVNGRAAISLPDHFRKLAVEDGMTVQLTPRAAESRGLAAVRVSLDGIEVRELANGTGNYSFDWRVEAARKGFEDYRVYQSWDQVLAPRADRDKAWQARLADIEARRQKQANTNSQ